MIPSGVQVFVAVEPVDLRCGFERLAAIARDRIGYDARCGALFVFVGRRRVTAKVLFFDGTGLCIVHKRLDRGAFQIPPSATDVGGHLEIDEAAFEALFDGLPIAPAADAAPSTRRRVH